MIDTLRKVNRKLLPDAMSSPGSCNDFMDVVVDVDDDDQDMCWVTFEKNSERSGWASPVKVYIGHQSFLVSAFVESSDVVDDGS